MRSFLQPRVYYGDDNDDMRMVVVKWWSVSGQSTHACTTLHEYAGIEFLFLRPMGLTQSLGRADLIHHNDHCGKVGKDQDPYMNNMPHRPFE